MTSEPGKQSLKTEQDAEGTLGVGGQGDDPSKQSRQDRLRSSAGGVDQMSYTSLQNLRHRDRVYIKGLRCDIVVGRDAWGRSFKKQPVIINACIYTWEAVVNAAWNDDVAQAIDYSKVCKDLRSNVDGEFEDLPTLSQHILTSNTWDSLKLEITLPRGVPHSSKGLVWVVERLADDSYNVNTPIAYILETTRIAGIQCSCIIGVNEHEFKMKQPVLIDISFKNGFHPPHYARNAVQCYQDIADKVFNEVECHTYKTVERLAEYVAVVVMDQFWIGEVTVNVEKPAAIPTIDTPGVQITRRKGFLQERGQKHNEKALGIENRSNGVQE